MGGLECGSPQGCASMENTVRCGGSHRAPAESWQASLATGEECSDPRKTREGAGRREKEETEQDQACTRDSRWGRGDRSRGLIPHQRDCSGQRAGIGGSWRAQQHIRDQLRLKGLRTMRTVPAAALCTPDRDARTLKSTAAGCWAGGIGSELNPRARSALTAGRGPGET